MGAILGLGVTHYPPLSGEDQNMARILKRVLQDPDLPERYRRPDGWPEPMRREYGADRGSRRRTATAKRSSRASATRAAGSTSSRRTSS